MLLEHDPGCVFVTTSRACIAPIGKLHVAGQKVVAINRSTAALVDALKRSIEDAKKKPATESISRRS